MGILIACNPRVTSSLTLNSSDIKQIEVFKKAGNKIMMKEGFEKEFITDLNKSKKLGLTKYGKTYRLIIHYINKKIDTIMTDGSIYQFENLYKSEENLIEKYKVKQAILSDTI